MNSTTPGSRRSGTGNPSEHATVHYVENGDHSHEARSAQKTHVILRGDRVGLLGHYLLDDLCHSLGGKTQRLAVLLPDPEYVAAQVPNVDTGTTDDEQRTLGTQSRSNPPQKRQFGVVRQKVQDVQARYGIELPIRWQAVDTAVHELHAFLHA